MSQKKIELSAQQINALSLLAEGLSNSETAKQCGVDRKTISRWRESEPFATELDRLLLAGMRQIEQNVYALRSLATERLNELLKSEDESISLKTCSLILSQPLETLRIHSAIAADQHTQRMRDLYLGELA